MKLPDEIREQFAELGKRGGMRTKELYGLKHLSEAGKKGQATRRKKRHNKVINSYPQQGA